MNPGFCTSICFFRKIFRENNQLFERDKTINHQSSRDNQIEDLLHPVSMLPHGWLTAFHICHRGDSSSTIRRNSFHMHKYHNSFLSLSLSLTRIEDEESKLISFCSVDGKLNLPSDLFYSDRSLINQKNISRKSANDNYTLQRYFPPKKLNGSTDDPIIYRSAKVRRLCKFHNIPIT